jgi:type IV pilus assembly protein PilO
MAASLSLNRLPWYGQILVFVVVALGFTGAFWNFYAAPARVSLDERHATLATLRAEIARGQRTAQNLPAFRQEVAGLEEQLGRLRAVLPEEQDVADLLRRVQAMATQSRLAIRGFTPRAVTRQQLHAEWPIGLQLEGTYHDLGAFLERVSKFPRIINVGNIKIKSRENQNNGVTITADCTATTFVLLETKGAQSSTNEPAMPGKKAA